MYFQRTGMISHRHPFHGGCVGCAGVGADPTGEAAKMYSRTGKATDAIDVYDLYYGQFDKRYVGVQGVPIGLGGIVDDVKAPVVRGIIFGLATFGVARAVGVDAAKAKRLGFVMAGMDIALSLIGGYLKKQAGGGAVEGFGWGAGRGTGI